MEAPNKQEKSTVIVNMKVTPSEKAKWNAMAKGFGKNLSQWIKGRCND